MGTYYAIMDDNNRRMMLIWKFYGIVDFVDAHAPFTVQEIASHKKYGDCSACQTDVGRYGEIVDGLFENIVDFCTEADWNIRVIDDGSTDEFHDSDYERFKVWLGNLVPEELSQHAHDSLDEQIKHRLFDRYDHKLPTWPWGVWGLSPGAPNARRSWPVDARGLAEGYDVGEDGGCC